MRRTATATLPAGAEAYRPKARILKLGTSLGLIEPPSEPDAAGKAAKQPDDLDYLRSFSGFVL
jgi:hypothetical protein